MKGVTMISPKRFFKLLAVIITAILILQTISCGTLIYPERRGQTTGRLDIGIVLLDAAGLLVFIIPGIVAFGIDFTTGAIYLPGSGRKSSGFDGKDNYKIVKVDPKNLNREIIEDVVGGHINQPVDLSKSNVETIQLRSLDMLTENIEKFNMRKIM